MVIAHLIPVFHYLIIARIKQIDLRGESGIGKEILLLMHDNIIVLENIRAVKLFYYIDCNLIY